MIDPEIVADGDKLLVHLEAICAAAASELFLV